MGSIRQVGIVGAGRDTAVWHAERHTIDMTVPSTVRAALTWIGRHSLGTLLSVLVLGAGLWAFAEIADEVREGETMTIDEQLVLAMREAGTPHDPVGPVWFENAMRDITALGGSTVLAPLVIAIAGFLLLRRAAGMALVVTVATVGAALLGWALKGAFDRPRPDLVPHVTEASLAAFPSGHALSSIAVYLTLAALLAAVQTSTIIKAYLLSWSIVLALAVGVSRVYLGVHWPTDVAAGWAIGAAWACAWWLVVQQLLKRRMISYPSAASAG